MLLLRIGMHDGLQVSCNSVCTCTESTRGKKSPHNIVTHNNTIYIQAVYIHIMWVHYLRYRIRAVIIVHELCI